MDPIEEAQGYAELNQLDGKYWTQDKIAEEFGLSQSDVSQSISLLSLPDDVKNIITRVIISKRHGVALAKLSDKTLQSKLGQQAAKEGWSVKELENKVKKAQEGSENPTKKEKKGQGDDPLSDLWAELGLKAQYKGSSKWSVDIDLGKVEDFKQAMADWAIKVTQIAKPSAKVPSPLAGEGRGEGKAVVPPTPEQVGMN